MIAAPSRECLSDQELRDFSSGRVPDARFESLLSHLDCCEPCQQRVESAASDVDSFLGALAAPNNDEKDPVLSEPDCQAALYHAVSRSPKTLDRVLPPIETLGPYRLIRPLGRGGMGAVYLAEHERLRRKFAVKLLPKERGLDADWLERFQREMQAVASLEHPNLIAATDAGDVAGWHYLVMEYLDGLDLAAIVRRLGSVPVESATAIMRDVCAALSALHDAGLIHRDVKPSNVMLTRDGTVKLLDLGLVLDGQSAADMRLTTVGHVLGTLAFAAPEQLSNRVPIDRRADLYGVGSTLFQLITGQPPHELQHGIGPLPKIAQHTSNPDALIMLLTSGNSVELQKVLALELNAVVQSSIAIATNRRSELRRSMPEESLRAIALPKNVDVIYKAESPDNRKIAFTGRSATAGKGLSIGLFVFDRITGESTKLIDGELNTRLAWSPDSKRIAIGNATFLALRYPLVIIDVESGAVDDTKAEGSGASWSPDGRYVAVSTESQRGGSWIDGVPTDGRIGIWDMQDRVMTHVSPPGTNRYVSERKKSVQHGGITPSFSPDGNWVAWRHVLKSKSGDGESGGAVFGLLTATELV